MVAKIISGKSIKAVLNYNENKVAKGKAELLYAENYGCDKEQLSYSGKLAALKMLTLQNHRTKTNAVHISLNFDKDDRLDKSQLITIAGAYMEKIGFGDQPYLVYQHFDAAHQHIHIVTTNIEDGGTRLSLHYIGKNQSETARKEIEIKFNLVKAESKQHAAAQLTPIPLEKAEYGKSETKAAISNIVREVVRSYKFTSIAELNAALRQFNVIADAGDEGTIKRLKKGLSYSLLDKSGQKVGVPIKASDIYGRPIISNLEKRYVQNAASKNALKQRLIHVLDKELAQPGALTRKQLQDNLDKHDVFILLRSNEEGRIYGVTYVDNATKCVFNGSDLGKAYSANAITERLREADAIKPRQPLAPFTPLKAAIPTGFNKGDSIYTILTESEQYQGQVNPHLLRKKKRPNI